MRIWRRPVPHLSLPTVLSHNKSLFMRRLLTGILTTVLLLLNTLALICPLMVFALLKLVLPGRGRDYASWAVMWIAETGRKSTRRSSPCASRHVGTSAASRSCAGHLLPVREQPPELGGHPGPDREPQPPGAVLQVLPQERADLGSAAGPGLVGAGLPLHEALQQGFLDKHPELKGKDPRSPRQPASCSSANR